MYHKLIISACLWFSILPLHAGCGASSFINVNHRQIFYCATINPLNHTAPSRWVDKCYVDSIRGDIGTTYANVYFHPGDSVILSDVGVVKLPGTYGGNVYSCYGNWIFQSHYNCYYLQDTLETYYRYHFDQHFIDSLAVAAQIFADSVSAVPATFYPNPIGETITFECFKTVQPPFDFQAFDYQGRCVLSRRVEFSDSYQTQTIDVSELQAGTYVAKYFINSKQYMRQIVKL